MGSVVAGRCGNGHEKMRTGDLKLSSSKINLTRISGKKKEGISVLKIQLDIYGGDVITRRSLSVLNSCSSYWLKMLLCLL